MIRVTSYWGFIVLGITGTMLGPALLPILNDFHITPAQAGPLFLAGSAGYLLAVLIGGPAGDHWKRTLVLRTGAIILTAGAIAACFAPAWGLLVGAMGLLSIGSGIVDSGTNALMNDASPPDGHAREQSLLHAFFGIGALLGPLLIGAFLALKAGWRPAYALGAIGAAVLVVMFARLKAPARSSELPAVNIRSMVALATTPFVLLLAMMTGAYVGAELLLGDWSATYMQKIHHLDKVAAATSVSLYWGGIAVGRLLSAAMTVWLTTRVLLVLTCVLTLLATTVLVLAPNPQVALLALAASGIGHAAVFPLVMAVAGEEFPDVSGSIAGLLIAASAICGAALPWLGGILVQYRDARAAIGLSLPAGVVMLAMALVILKRGRTPLQLSRGTLSASPDLAVPVLP